jgi:hypothetical protein
MKRHVFFTGVALAVILVPSIIQAGWARTYGADQDDVGYCVQETSDGGFIVAGYQEGMGGWLLKIDEQGDTLWTSAPFGFANGSANSVQQTSDGGYIATGYQAATDDGKYHLALSKVDSLGEELWTRLDGYWFTHDSTGGIGLSVDETSDGGYILTGYRKPFIFGDITDLWLIKTDSAGEFEWSKTHGAENPDWGACVRQTSDGGYIIAGYTSTDLSYMVLKTDVAGDTVWVSGLPFSWYSKGQWVEQTSDGGYITAGYGVPLEDGKDHLVVMKMTSNGDTAWMRMEQGWFPDQLGGVSRCVRQTSDDNFILTGHTAEWIDEIDDLFLVKLNPDGDTLWTRIYGGADQDMGYCVDQTADGGFIVVGATKSFGAGGFDIWLLRTDSEGDTLSGIEESVIDGASNWQILSPVGREIVLRYEGCPHGFHASVFDAAGRRVDELHSTEQSGTVTWPVTHQSPGVYFIKQAGQTEPLAKVVLIR